MHFFNNLYCSPCNNITPLFYFYCIDSKCKPSANFSLLVFYSYTCMCIIILISLAKRFKKFVYCTSFAFFDNLVKYVGSRRENVVDKSIFVYASPEGVLKMNLIVVKEIRNVLWVHPKMSYFIKLTQIHIWIF